MKNRYAVTRKGRFATDALGRRATLKWALYDRFGRFFPRALVRDIRRSIARRHRRFGLNALQMGFVSIVVGVGCLIAIGFGRVLVGIPLGLVWICVEVVRQRMRDPHPLIVEELLARRLCAACGYDLAGSALDDGGRGVCSECGSAWTLSPCDAEAGGPRRDSGMGKVKP